MEHFLKSRIAMVEAFQKSGLRTKMGKKILKNGFEERKDFIEKALQGIKERPDFLISPDDLL